MKPKIKRTKQPDEIEYRGNWERGEKYKSFTGENIFIQGNFNKLNVAITARKARSLWLTLTLPEAEELAEILPKFLEEMERTK